MYFLIIRSKMLLMKDIINLIHREKLPLLVKTIVVFAVVAGLLVLLAEQSSSTSGIKTFFDAVWWAFVTITTVGYGDNDFVILIANQVL
jgi:voltage-gated potassium channel